MVSWRSVLLGRIGGLLPRNEQTFAVFEATRTAAGGTGEPVIVVVASSSTWLFSDAVPSVVLDRWRYSRGTKPFPEPVDGVFEMQGHRLAVDRSALEGIRNALYVRSPIDLDEVLGWRADGRLIDWVPRHRRSRTATVRQARSLEQTRFELLAERDQTMHDLVLANPAEVLPLSVQETLGPELTEAVAGGCRLLPEVRAWAEKYRPERHTPPG